MSFSRAAALTFVALGLLFPPPIAAESKDPSAAPPSGKSPGRETFDFEIPDIDGGVIAGKALRGKIVVVDVWGTWCGPCRQIVPHLVDLQARFQKRGVEVIGISAEPAVDYETAVRRIRDFAREFRINYRLGILTEQVYSKIQRAMRYQGNQFTVPATLVLDRDGVIIARYPGYFFGQEKEIAELIGQRLAREGPLESISP